MRDGRMVSHTGIMTGFIQRGGALLILGALLMAVSVDNALARETLTIYSHRHYPLDRELFDQFERMHGVKINVLQARADELIERIVAEGARTKADLLVTVSAIRLQRALERGILSPFRSARIEANIPAALRHGQNYWTALTTRARVIVYNRAAVRPLQVARYSDLALSRWRGRLVMRASTHVYNVSLLSAMIGNRGRQQAERWVDAVADNLARPPRGNDRDQIRAVARGKAASDSGKFLLLRPAYRIGERGAGYCRCGWGVVSQSGRRRGTHRYQRHRHCAPFIRA